MTSINTNGNGAPHTGRFVSYLRVSTEKQGATGLGMEAQRKAVADYLNGGNWTLLAEYIEVESGKRNDRPQLAAALAHAKATGAILVIAKLDRLSRDAHFLLGLQKAAIPFVACDMPQADQFTVGILAMVAQREAEMISSRTKAAMDVVRSTIAREGSWVSRRSGNTISRLGNPNGARALRDSEGWKSGAGPAALRAQADRHAAQVLPMIEAIRADGITGLKAIARELTARGILTARGGQWDATRVRNLLARRPDMGQKKP